MRNFRVCCGVLFAVVATRGILCVEEHFDYEIVLQEQPSSLGVQLDESLKITAFAPSSVLKDHGEPQIGDQLLQIAEEPLNGLSRIRTLLKESVYPLSLTLRAIVTESRTCVAPPKGGLLRVDVVGDEAGPAFFDYLAADFATGDMLFEEATQVVLADPPQACYDNIKNAEEVPGKVVLVSRGRCSFMAKIEYLERLGAKGVVVMNDAAGLLHIPSPPLGGPRKSLPTIPAVMITAQAGLALRKLVASTVDSDENLHPVTAACNPDVEVAKLWQQVSPLLVSSKAWPEDASERRKKYRKLSQIHHPDKPRGSQDRFGAIAEAYKRANYELNPEVQAQYSGIDDYMENA